jgi:hypothetical protein
MGGVERKSQTRLSIAVENSIISDIFEEHPQQFKQGPQNNGEQDRSGNPVPIHSGNAGDVLIIGDAGAVGKIFRHGLGPGLVFAEQAGGDIGQGTGCTVRGIVPDGISRIGRHGGFLRDGIEGIRDKAAEVRENARESVREAVRRGGDIRGDIRGEVRRGKLLGRVYGRFGRGSGFGLGDRLGDGFRDGLRDGLRDRLRNGLRDRLGDRLRGGLRGGFRFRFGFRFGGGLGLRLGGFAAVLIGGSVGIAGISVQVLRIGGNAKAEDQGQEQG